ncbi:MAG: WbqC family protein [Cyclobacteriaceae bacterium]|nr:WbqC family protein [Cyclobacteriaceae bacterium]
MIVSIHQPHFLPWLGYFNKVWNSDVFVWLHNVQYRKNYFQSRTKIKNPHTGEAFWLTVPVHATLGTPIDEVVEANSRWRASTCKTLEQFYRKAHYYNEFGPELIDLITTSDANLDQLNYRLFMTILKKLEYTGTVIRVEELLPLSAEPNERLIEICQKLNADTYIAGRGGKNYLNTEQWKEVGIKIIWQDFSSEKVIYSQLGTNFIPGLSIIDCLFNEGVVNTRSKLIGAWQF